MWWEGWEDEEVGVFEVGLRVGFVVFWVRLRVCENLGFWVGEGVDLV